MKSPASVLVFGMHRSGTSALTRALHLGGFALPRTLLESRADNPDGYWESARLVAMNEQILRALGGHGLAAFTRQMGQRASETHDAITRDLARVYERECAGDRSVVIKDPRLCLLGEAHLAALRHLDRRAVAVLVLRDPASAARSLSTRNVITREYAGLLWRQHVLLAERATRSIPRCVVWHAEFLHDPAQVVANVRALALGAESELRPVDGDAIRAWVRGERVHWRPDDALNTDAEREVIDAIADRSSTRNARLDAALERAFDDCRLIEPGCDPAWLILQSEVTIGWAQVAALVMDAGASAEPGAIERHLRGQALRPGDASTSDAST